MFGADGCAVKLAEIYSYFGGPSMADKSKLFLIQVRFVKSFSQTNSCDLPYSNPFIVFCASANIDRSYSVVLFIGMLQILCS